ncbi:threonine/serine exporter family protein [Peptostreptococcus stomatis]|uniref:threonine/serine exporter family protein n=1 Tax=Peptostreptococcus stomatis TaxID=341694 RepID=UPI0028E70DF0|nr:threonine/serine exporter family protein [Peptostreptococcus stomatis]
MITQVPLWQHFIFAGLATCGFAIFFNVQPKLLLWTAPIGALGWLVYVLGVFNYENPMIYSFTAAAVISLCSEILARRLKQPAILFVIPGILPLVPGVGLYQTIYSIMFKKYGLAATIGTKSVIVSIGIALGILVVASLSRVFNLYQLKKAFTRNDTARYVDWVNLGKNRTGNQFILDRDELNEHLNSLNIDTESYKKSDLDKMEKNSSQDVILDKKSKDNNLDLG